MGIINLLCECENPVWVQSKGTYYACGKCPSCNTKRASEWALRTTHEWTTKGNKATFLTLTYKNENLITENIKKNPKYKNDCGATLVKKELQDFIKRLRKHIKKNAPEVEWKYIACGEYGEAPDGTNRPHYHILLIGISPEELDQYTKIYSNAKKKGHKKDYELIRSNLWKKGNICWDKKNGMKESIKYVTGYIRKKTTDKKTLYENYEKYGKLAPFKLYSKGIGKKWALNNYKMWYKTGIIETSEGQRPVPRYYEKTLVRKYSKTYKYRKIVLDKTITRKVDDNIAGVQKLKEILGIKNKGIRNKYEKAIIHNYEWRYITIPNLRNPELLDYYEQKYKRKEEKILNTIKEVKKGTLLDELDIDNNGRLYWELHKLLQAELAENKKQAKNLIKKYEYYEKMKEKEIIRDLEIRHIEYYDDWAKKNETRGKNEIKKEKEKEIKEKYNKSTTWENKARWQRVYRNGKYKELYIIHEKYLEPLREIATRKNWKIRNGKFGKRNGIED